MGRHLKKTAYLPVLVRLGMNLALMGCRTCRAIVRPRHSGELSSAERHDPMQLLHKAISSRNLLTLTILAGLGLSIVPQDASAQPLLFNLDGVTFEYGVTASGHFESNSALHDLGAYDIATTGGHGSNYSGTGMTPSQIDRIVIIHIGDFGFSSDNVDELHLLLSNSVTKPGSFMQSLAKAGTNSGFTGSREYFTRTSRLITSGSLVVTDPSAVPESSASASFAVGALKLAGLAVVAGRRRTLENKKPAEVASA